MAMEVCKGCFRISRDYKYGLYVSIEVQTFVRCNFLRVASESYTSFLRVYVELFCTSTKILNEGPQDIRSDSPSIPRGFLIKQSMHDLDRLVRKLVSLDHTFRG